MVKLFKLLLIVSSFYSFGCLSMQPNPQKPQEIADHKYTSVDITSLSIDQKLDQFGVMLKNQSEEQSQIITALAKIESGLEKMNQNFKTIKKVAIVALVISAIPIALTIADRIAKH